MIELNNICRLFQMGEQEIRALDQVNLTIQQGEYLSIMGPSGSGKSTLLNLIGLLDKPSSGNYQLFGNDVTQLNDNELAAIRRKRIGFVFQTFHLVARMTAAENIGLPLLLDNIPAAERNNRVSVVLDAVGLSDRAHHRPDQLSGGQRQRVAIARATILKPSILLADEPTGNLDRVSGNEIVTVLEKLNTLGITLIVVTHDPDLGARASRRIRMVDGRIDSDQRDAL